MKKLYLVDVSSMYFRAFYAIRPLSNSKGLPTNALYGFISMTIKLLREVKPDYMAFCFDHKKKSFRVDIDSRYKANRDEMPEDLQKQVPYIRRIVDALGIPAFESPGYEADDIIGTLTHFGRSQNLEVKIVSGDKDFGQLVNEYVTIFDPMKDVTLDAAAVTEKFGVRPDQVIDYLAIVGDSSDNVAGVKGVGPKGAQKLLNEFETLDGIYKNLDKVKPDGVAKKMKESKDEAYLAKKLVTIVTDMDIKPSLQDVQLRQIHRPELKDLFQELEFKNFERTLLGESSSSTSASTGSDSANDRSDESNEETTKASDESKEKYTSPMVAAVKVNPTPQVSTSFESDEETITISKAEKLFPQDAELWALWTVRGLSLGYKNTAYMIDGDIDKLSQLLSDKKIRWKGYDLKEFWRGFKLEDPKASWDHMLAAYVVRAQPVEGFTNIYSQYVGDPFPELPSPAQWHNAHRKLEVALKRRLKENSGERVYNDLEIPLIPVLYKMESKGVLLDLDILKKESKALFDDIRAIETEIHKEVGEVFNIASPKQLGQILFEKLKMPAGKKTKTGYSTDSGVLEKLREEFPITGKILEYRELSKLKSTYVDSLPLLVNPETGRVHTTFAQAMTATGRLSSINPNLQNIPIRTARGRGIRRAFIAGKGSDLISADYSQIELRILAHITDDAALKRAFADNLDIHTATAAEIFGQKLDQVTPELRRAAKAVNFGIAYGMSAFGLADRLEMPQKEAKEIIQRYFLRFPKVREYMDSIVETAKQQRFVESIFGRRRYIDELFAKNQMQRAFGERAAINAPIQGSASDIVKKAMIEIDKTGEFDLLLQVHDELIFEGDKKKSKAESQKIKKVMENVVELKVPLVVEVGTGPNWDEAH